MGQGGYRQINKALNIEAFEEYLVAQQAMLPELPDVEQISPRVIRVLGQNAGQFTLQGTNTYIVGTGAERLLIDAGQGVPEWAALMAETLATQGIRLSHVLLTHWHGDHTGGVPDLIQMDPQLADRIYINSPSPVQQPIVDGQVFRVEGATVRALHTPGHSHDHMCFILEEESALFTGDNILGHGSSAVEDLGVYMATLRKMQAQHCRLGYAAHGAVITNLPLKIAGELAAKLRRERQILRQLREEQARQRAAGQRRLASLTVKELVAALYGAGVGERVRTEALEPFMDEVLRKLAGDGSVAFESRRGEKKWFMVEVA